MCLLRRYESCHEGVGGHAADLSANSCDPAASAAAESSSSSSPSKAVSSTAMELSSRIQLVGFLMSTVAYLPYDLIDEPLVAIHWINRIVSVSTTVLLGEMRQVISF